MTILPVSLFGIFDLVQRLPVYPLLSETAVTADISVNIHSGENSRAYHDVIAGTVGARVTVNYYDVSASAFWTHFRVFYIKSPQYKRPNICPGVCILFVVLNVLCAGGGLKKLVYFF